MRLLERTGLRPDLYAAVETYVQRQAPETTGFERTMAEITLGGKNVRSDVLAEVVRAAPDFTGSRKRVLAQALLAVVGAPGEITWEPAAFDTAFLHSWASVQMTAAKVILAAVSGQSARISDEDVRCLADTQRAPRLWEGNVLIHLSVLHALTLLPNTGRLVAAGVDTLAAQVRSDGGLPFVSDVDTWCTATAGVALAAVNAAEPTLRALADRLAACQQPGGGWSYSDTAVQTDVDDTSVAVQFLDRVDSRRYRGSVRRGIRSLMAVRGTDGGFPTYVAGAASEASMTAAALDALTLRSDRHAGHIAEGLRFLVSQQNEDGSFPPDWSSSRLHTVCRVLLCTSRRPRSGSATVRRMVGRAAALVIGGQNDDGGWGQQAGDASDVISTAYGLTALCSIPDADPRAAAVAAEFLAHAPRGADGLQAIPDSIGPRPFVFTVPVLAEIFTLLALGHFDRRLAAPAARAQGTTRG
ncbi:prenyltransferase/squalene oxidase repeat-containing protein [Amycolatopsis coloradensis]|nr:prenyltransferase/squalene oxidase repeat-containing protein [Amycolatopsis coloradensis]